MSDTPPKPGDFITSDDVTKILELYRYRQKNFDGESEETSMRVVLLNVGDIFTPIRCIKGEWTGLKSMIPVEHRDVMPKCPNGHVLIEGRGMKLGWVAEE